LLPRLELWPREQFPQSHLHFPSNRPFKGDKEFSLKAVLQTSLLLSAFLPFAFSVLTSIPSGRFADGSAVAPEEEGGDADEDEDDSDAGAAGLGEDGVDHDRGGGGHEEDRGDRVAGNAVGGRYAVGPPVPEDAQRAERVENPADEHHVREELFERTRGG